MLADSFQSQWRGGATVLGLDPSVDFGAQPNKRLKLAAPVLKGSLDVLKCGVVKFCSRTFQLGAAA